MKKMLLIVYCYVLSMCNVRAQNVNPLFIGKDSITTYHFLDMQGRLVVQGSGLTIVNDLPNGLYIIYPGMHLVVVINGAIRGYRNFENVPKDSVIVPMDSNTKCATSRDAGLPFNDSTSLMNYLHGRIDHLGSVEEKLIEITRFATEFYPHSNHGSWVSQSWMYTFDQVVNHFLQTDSMGMCGDQATFLGNFFYRLLGIRTCSISIAMNTSGTNGVDTLNNGHVQLLAEIPQLSGTKKWVIFDSQNGVVYRDDQGTLIDFRDIFYRVKRPYADELAPRGRFYNEWPCLGREYEWPFPFDSTHIYYRETTVSSGIDTMVTMGQRKLSFIMQDKFWGLDYRTIAETHGITTDTMNAKELSDMIPVMTVGIYETTHYGPTGIEPNILFAQEVRQMLGLPGLVWNSAPLMHFRKLTHSPH